MKIIEMQRLTLDGEPVVYDAGNENGEDYNDWWCVIETPEEELVYDKCIYGDNPSTYKNIIWGIWDAMVRHAGEGMGVAWGDDDMYGYIRPAEDVPEVLEKFVDSDGDTWLRKE